MYRLSLFLVFFSCVIRANAQAPRFKYETKWREIDSLIAKAGLTQSALMKVNDIYLHASRDHNDAERIKALIYKMSLQERNLEDGAKINISDLEKDITASIQPAKSILESLLASVYWNYFQSNRWTLYGRTTTVNFSKNDLTTWSVDDFHHRISSLYLLSVSEGKILQETKVEQFDPIIIKGNARSLRPTLYDLLAHRALDYFKNGEIDVTKPSFAFELEDPAVFADKTEFAKYSFHSDDSVSSQFAALKLFQQLIRYHLHDVNPEALIDVDIERIEFVHRYASIDNRDELYQKALKNIAQKFPTSPQSAQAWYLQALFLDKLASGFDAIRDTSNRFDYVQAKSICERIIGQKDSSAGKTNCENLLQSILQSALAIETEKVNLPNVLMRALVSYRNVSRIFVRIIKLDHSQHVNLLADQWQPTYCSKLAQMEAVRSLRQDLPVTSDYQLHRVEIKLDSLPVGEYALLASTDENFDEENNLMVAEYFYVSGIALVNSGLNYFVLHRDSGQPIARANVQFWYTYYNAQQKRYLERMGEDIVTDKNGYFRGNPSKTNRNTGNTRIELTSINDHLFLADEVPGAYITSTDAGQGRTANTEYEKANRRTFLFIDRAIYRPGQILYFKGIVVTKDITTRLYKICSQFTTKVILYDVNEQPVDSLSLTTNDYGSFNGKFRIPENRLNGQFKIADDSTGDDKNFAVEEYKRPSFFVAYQPVPGPYRINDSVLVTGYAMGYSGNPIDGAMVKYRITRRTYVNQWLQRQETTQEIAHGVLRSTKDGKFPIRFLATADKKIGAESEPVFVYTVSADVTDISGESITAATTVSAGYRSLRLSIALPNGGTTAGDSLNKIIIDSRNLARAYEATKVSIVICRLSPPDRLIRQRYWDEPDQFIMTKDEYLKLFPHDEYSNESQPAKWERLDTVFKKTDSTSSNGLIGLGNSVFSRGWYSVEAIAHDAYGSVVKAAEYIQIYDSKNSRPGSSQYCWDIPYARSYQPGDKARIPLGSSASGVFVIADTGNAMSLNEVRNAGMDTSYPFKFFALNNEKKDIDLNISPADRGGIGVNYFFIKDNRFYAVERVAEVPWTNKDLSINFETYRDKTTPGDRENWKVRITGNKKERVAAEVLTAMYDASLDQFYRQRWQVPSIYPIFSFSDPWNADIDFSDVTSTQQRLGAPLSSLARISYDQLLSAPGDASSVRVLLRGRMQGLAIATDSTSTFAFGRVYRGAPGTTVTLVARQGKSADTAAEEEMTKSDNGPSLAYSEIQVRRNMQETSFFMPELRTDSSGNVEFSFTMPDAITAWKWMIFAHTKDLSFGYAEKEIIARKELMVQPNFPRFLRAGDNLTLGVKIVNLTDSEMTGQTELMLFDAESNEPVDGLFINREANQYFTVEPKQSVLANFSIDVPFQFNKPVIFRVIARAKNISDGEESVLPVLSNQQLVTETLPFILRGESSKTLTLDKLVHSGNSETLTSQKLVVEFTQNPAWYAVQALPFLNDYRYECAEQAFDRFYANCLASKIISALPQINSIFRQWRTVDSAALQSNLEKNQDLKSILLEETPWVLEAKDESQEKKNISVLFDTARAGGARSSALNSLRDMQLPDGSFCWFKGGTDDRYITQYILTGFGHLKKLGALTPGDKLATSQMIANAIAYLDKKIRDEYAEVVNRKSGPPDDHLGSIQIQYLYMRSFFDDVPMDGETFRAVNYFRKQTQQLWLQQNKYMQGMIGLYLFRTGDVRTANQIVNSLRQNAINDPEAGMYWKENTGGIHWYQSPIETESLLLEAFHEISHDEKSVDNMKVWMLRQKQSENWKTTRSTADACYALLMQGADLLAGTRHVTIHLGNQIIASGQGVTEGGTGFLKIVIDGKNVKPEMGNITVSLSDKNKTPAGGSPLLSWGALYWQYFEDLDKITARATPLEVIKNLFVEENSDRGPRLVPVADNGTVKIGDKIVVRIELHVSQDMEYVHLKDLRASCLEPVTTISNYLWRGGLGYYQSTKDASMNFFFAWLPKGTYIFEYSLMVAAAGTFNNGIATIQSMYAPEFNSHSNSIRINAE